MTSLQIELKKFGQVFSSRSEGRETALSIIAYHFNKSEVQILTINFEEVLIMTPSWLSEFIQTLKQHGVSEIKYINHTNKSVASSIDMVEEEKLVSGS